MVEAGSTPSLKKTSSKKLRYARSDFGMHGMKCLLIFAILPFNVCTSPQVLGEKTQIYKAVPTYVTIIRGITADPMGSITMQARASTPTT
jgi:hypothetical protein